MSMLAPVVTFSLDYMFVAPACGLVGPLGVCERERAAAHPVVCWCCCYCCCCTVVQCWAASLGMGKVLCGKHGN